MSSLQCEKCGSDDVININLTMEDGDPVAFYSCHGCENRWWNRSGEPLPLARVLELARRAKGAKKA